MVENRSGLQKQGYRLIRFISRMLTNPLVKAGIGIFLLLLLTGAGLGVRQTQLIPSQPIQYPHNTHLKLGMQCIYCHAGALRGPSPGLPTEAKCNGCHQQITKTSPELVKLSTYIKNNQPIQWIPVAILPDFVYFSHRPHIAAGLNCENCHGELSQMTVARPQKMNMGWCLDCHRTRFKGNSVMLLKLTDCVTCHK